MKDVKRRGQKEHKTKRYKQIQIYITTIHAIKHFKTYIPVCVFVCV